MFDPSETHDPPTPRIQELRLQYLRELVSSKIPCILWAEDVLLFAHGVPTELFDQQVLVPDHLLEAAIDTLQKNKYSLAPINPSFTEEKGPLKGTSAWPKGTYLKHNDIPMDRPYEMYRFPRGIFLLPTSYYELDVRKGYRFQSLVPPLAEGFADILVPKYHTMLEPLVYAMLHPPGGYNAGGLTAARQHQQYISYLLMYRIKYNPDDPDDIIAAKRKSHEEEIFNELQTEDARWYFRRTFSKGPFTRQDMVNYLQGNAQLSPISLMPPWGSKLKPSVRSELPTTASRSRPYSTYTLTKKTVSNPSFHRLARQFSAQRIWTEYIDNLLKRR